MSRELLCLSMFEVVSFVEHPNSTRLAFVWIGCLLYLTIYDGYPLQITPSACSTKANDVMATDSAKGLKKQSSPPTPWSSPTLA